MEPLASRFDSPRAATPTASLTFLFSHTWDSRQVLLQTPPDRQLNRRGPLYPLPVELPVAIFYVGLSAGVFLTLSLVRLRPKKANSLPSPRQGQVPWDGLTASLDMEPLASRFDSPGQPPLRLRLHSCFPIRGTLGRCYYRHRRTGNSTGGVPIPLPVELPVAIFTWDSRRVFF